MAKVQSTDPNNRISNQLAEDLNMYLERRQKQRRQGAAERVGRFGFAMAGAPEFMPQVTSQMPLSRETAAEMAVAGADIKRRVAEMKAAIQTEGMVADRRKMTNLAQMMDSLADVTVAMIEVKGGYNTEVLKQQSTTSREASRAATEKLENEGWKLNIKLQAAGLSSNSRSQLESRYGGLISMDQNTGMKSLPDPSSSEGKMLGQSLIADIQQRDPQILAHWMDRMDRRYGMSADDMQAYIGVGSGSSDVARKVQTQMIDALRQKDIMKRIDAEYESIREAHWDKSLRAARMAGVDNPMLQQAEILRASMEVIDPDAGTDLSETKLGKFFSGGEMDPDFADPAMEAADALMEAFQDPYAPDSIKKLKAGIMQSQDFRTYMDSNQFTDPEQAFKYLIQDNRKKMREQKQETIRQRKINMGKVVPEEANLRGAVAAEKGVEGGPVTEGSKKGLGSALLTAGSKVFGGKRAAARAKALGLDPGALSEMGESSKGLEDMSRQELRDLPTDLTPEEAELEGLDPSLTPEQQEAQAEQVIESHSKVGAGTNPLEEGGTFQANDGKQYRWDAKGFFVDTSGEGEQIPINSEQGMSLFSEFKAAVEAGEADSSAQTYLTDVDTPFDEIDEAVSAEEDFGMGRPGTTQTEKEGSKFLTGNRTRLGSADVDNLSQWEVWKELDKRGLLSEKERAQLDVTRGEVSTGDTQADRTGKNITMRRMLKDNMLDEASFGRARDRLFNHLKTEVGAGEERRFGGTRKYRPIYEEDESGRKILKGYEEEQIGRKETRTGGYIPLSPRERNRLVADYVKAIVEKTGANPIGEGIVVEQFLGTIPEEQWAEVLVPGLEKGLKRKGYEIVRGREVKSGEVSGDDLDKLLAMSKDEGLTWEHVNQMKIQGDPTGERGDPLEEDIDMGRTGGKLVEDAFLPEAGEKYGGGLTRSFEEEEEEDEAIPVPSVAGGPSADIARRLSEAKRKNLLKEVEMKQKGQTMEPTSEDRMEAALQARKAAEEEKRRKNEPTGVWQ